MVQTSREVLRLPNLAYWRFAEPAIKTFQVSPALCKMLGYHEIEGPQPFRAFEALLHPGDKKLVADSIEGLLSAQSGFSIGVRLLGANDRWLHAQMSGGWQLTDDNRQEWGGTVVGLGRWEDQPVRPGRAPELLIDAEEIKRYKLLYDHSPEFLFSVDPDDGTIRHANETMVRVLGYSHASLGSHSLHELCHPDSIDKAQEVLELHRQKQQVNNVELLLLNAEGEIYEVTLKSYYIKGEEPQTDFNLFVMREISKEKAIYMTMFNSEARFRSLTENLPIGIAISPANGILQYTNKTFASMIGYAPEDLVGMPWKKLTHPEDVNNNLGLLQQMLEQRLPKIEFEKRYFHRDGHIVYCKLAVVNIWDEFSGEQQILAAIEDVTEKKLHAQQLQQVNKELEQLMYSVSHDLRAPLRHIISFAKMLDRMAGPKFSEEEARFMSYVIQSGNRLGVLIDELLQFARGRNPDLNPQWVDLHQLVHECKALFEADTRKRNIEWVVGPLSKVYADPVLLEKVVQNLLSNAVKYTSKKPASRIEIQSELTPDGVQITVKDNGAGFEMEYQQKLFAIFQRLHKQSEFEGNGIGLASVQRIIQRHNGKIWAEGEVDKGASFYFTLPNPKKLEPS